MMFFTRQGRGQALLLAAAVGVGAVCVSNAFVQGSAGAGTFTDKRDGKTYKTVKMPDGKTWMAANLNYATKSGSWCYDNKSANCNKYGRLYEWATAMTVCPSGWHLPSRVEWGELGKAAGGTGKYGDEGGNGDVDTKLKSKTGWGKNGYGRDGNGTDEYGFSALPGGHRDSSDTKFVNAGTTGLWWTADEETGAFEGEPFYRCAGCSDGSLVEGYSRTEEIEGEYFRVNGLSVRCLKD